MFDCLTLGFGFDELLLLLLISILSFSLLLGSSIIILLSFTLLSFLLFSSFKFFNCTASPLSSLILIYENCLFI